jgi:hypothetical protein
MKKRETPTVTVRGGFFSAGEQAKNMRQQIVSLVEYKKKFTGRKPGSYGPIKKLMKKKLLSKKSMKNRQLERALANAGCRIYEDRRHSGAFIEGPRGDTMSYDRFRKAASEVRSDLKAK